MYDYSEYVDKYYILSRITQEEIFALVLGYLPQDGEELTSPFREEDRRPGCFFEYFNDTLYFVDFGDDKSHRTCFDFVMEHYELSYMDSLYLIRDKLELQDKEMKYEVKPQTGNNSLKKKSQIKAYRKNFSIADLKYWKSYGISLDNLLEDEVSSLNWFSFYSVKKKKWVTIKPNTVTFSICKFNKRTKVYTPHSKSLKWISSCGKNDVGALNLLPNNGDYLVITKSYKDCRVLRNQGIRNSVWFQSENTIPSDNILFNLLNRFKDIFIFYDNDEPGQVGSTALNKKIQLLSEKTPKQIFLPDIHSKIKDPSDLYFYKGKEELNNFLTKIGWNQYLK